MDQANRMEIWYTRCPVPTASSIAIDERMLERAFEGIGVSVTSLRASTQMGVRNSHFDHSQENSFREGGNIPPIWTRSNGGSTKLIACGWVDEYQSIVAMPSSGMEKVQDLKGRRLGVPRRVNDMVDYWRAMCLRAYLSALDVANLSRDEVEFVDLPIEESYIGSDEPSRSGTLWSGGHRARRQQAEAFALIRGDVDAIYTAGAPGAQLTAFLGARTVFDLGGHPDPLIRTNNQVPTILTVSGELLEDRPDIVDQYVTTLIDAAEWAEGNLQSVRRIVANDVGATEEWVAAAYAPDFHARLAPNLRPECIEALKRQKNFLVLEGFVAHDFEVEEWLDPGPLTRCGRF